MSSTLLDPLLEAQGILVEMGGRRLLDGVGLKVARGQILTLIGPNGAGKTTLVRVLIGLLRPKAGWVRRGRGLRLGYMPQRLALSPALPLTVGRFLHLATGVVADRAKTLETLARLGIDRLFDSPMQTISGGETQRVLLARAVLRRPSLLILDEPVQGVDVSGQEELYRLIVSLRDELGCGVIMVSHDLHLVMAATDQVVCLNHHVCCTGSPEAVTRHPAYVELFGSAARQFAVYAHHHDHAHGPSGEVVGEGDAHG